MKVFYIVLLILLITCKNYKVQDKTTKVPIKEYFYKTKVPVLSSNFAYANLPVHTDDLTYETILRYRYIRTSLKVPSKKLAIWFETKGVSNNIFCQEHINNVSLSSVNTNRECINNPISNTLTTVNTFKDISLYINIIQPTDSSASSRVQDYQCIKIAGSRTRVFLAVKVPSAATNFVGSQVQVSDLTPSLTWVNLSTNNDCIDFTADGFLYYTRFDIRSPYYDFETWVIRVFQSPFYYLAVTKTFNDDEFTTTGYSASVVFQDRMPIGDNGEFFFLFHLPQCDYEAADGSCYTAFIPANSGCDGSNYKKAGSVFHGYLQIMLDYTKDSESDVYMSNITRRDFITYGGQIPTGALATTNNGAIDVNSWTPLPKNLLEVVITCSNADNFEFQFAFMDITYTSPSESEVIMNVAFPEDYVLSTRQLTQLTFKKFKVRTSRNWVKMNYQFQLLITDETNVDTNTNAVYYKPASSPYLLYGVPPADSYTQFRLLLKDANFSDMTN